jgi:predicted nucleic acid-binding protein
MKIERNINKKFASSLPLYKEYLNKLQFTIIPLPDKEKVAIYNDLIHPKDAPLIASAIKGKADYLVTGDKKDFKTEELLKANLPVKIINPAEALTIIEKVLLRHPKKYGN